MEIIESILTNNPCYKAGNKIKVKGLMLHSVGCPQPNAETFVKNWNKPESSRACVHAFIDGNTGKVYQTLPWDHKAWHCGGNANGTHIGVEMCEPSCIKYTGGSSFTCSDRDAAMAVVKRTYEVSVELFAFLCKKYGLDPLADGVIISHKEGHDRGLASGHGDPDHLWNGMQSGYTMDGFRKAVAAAMGNDYGDTLQQTKDPAAVTGTTADAAKKSSAATDTSSAAVAENVSIQTGDIVGLSSDAIYYTGKAMPAWVISDKWIVKSIAGDRAVIDKNESGTRSINSPVSTKYLKVIHKGSGASQPGTSKSGTAASSTPQSAPVPGVTAAEAGQQGQMAVSDRGVELIAKYEGCRLEAYKCPAGVWTIGYGHTAGVNPGDKLPDEAGAKALLKEDLKKYGGYVNSCVQKGLITFPLTQNQFDALTSFTYNCGNGSLQKLVSGRDAATVAEKMLQYNKGGGKVLAGLTKRREEERALFLQ